MRIFSWKTLLVLGAPLLAFLMPSTSAAMNLDAVLIGDNDWVASFGYDANAEGKIVGFYTDPTVTRGFVSREGKTTDVHPPGWDVSIARGISDNGIIVGLGNDGVSTKGFLYSGGSYTDIAPAGWTNLDFSAVNNGGQVAGAGNDGGGQKGLLCNGGSCTPIIPPAWTSASCNGISNGGQLACEGSDAGIQKGFLYDGGTYTPILPPGWISAAAWGLNDSGQLVGSGDNGGGGSGCFVYQGGSYTIIPPPPGMVQLQCQTIDENGVVVGFAVDPVSGSYKTVVWSQGAYFTYPAPMSSYLFLPFGKMRGGFFTGYALTPTPRAYAARLTPAPDLKVGPYDGPGNIGPGTSFSMTASLSAGIFKKARGDYWLMAQHPSGTYSFDARSQSWRPGIFPAAQGPLTDFSGKRVFTTTGLPPGLYTFYLAVDMNMNGIPDTGEWHYDTLFFFVR